MTSSLPNFDRTTSDLLVLACPLAHVTRRSVLVVVQLLLDLRAHT